MPLVCTLVPTRPEQAMEPLRITNPLTPEKPLESLRFRGSANRMQTRNAAQNRAFRQVRGGFSRTSGGNPRVDGATVQEWTNAMTEIVVAVITGVFLILITPSVMRQQDRLWGKRQKARIEKARELADDPAALVIWALVQVLIVGLTALLGLTLIILPAAVAVIDLSRGLRVEGFSLFMLMVMILIGFPLVYLAIRGGSQVLTMLESIKSGDAASDAAQADPGDQPSQ